MKRIEYYVYSNDTYIHVYVFFNGCNKAWSSIYSKDRKVVSTGCMWSKAEALIGTTRTTLKQIEHLIPRKLFRPALAKVKAEFGS